MSNMGKHLANSKFIHSRATSRNSPRSSCWSPPENFVAAESWHSDVTFHECRQRAQCRRAGLPPYGGDTAWQICNSHERLPDGLKEQIEGLYAIHSYEKVFGANRTGHRHAVDEVVEKAKEQYPPAAPDRSNAPETGIKSLFINRNFVTGIDGMTQDESVGLPPAVRAGESTEITCRFRWQPGSVAQWDNRCSITQFPITAVSIEGWSE